MKQRMGELAGQHIGLITVGDSNQHIGINDAGTPEDFGERSVAGNCLNIQTTAQIVQQVDVVIHQGNIIGLRSEISCNRGADLPCTQNQDFHCISLGIA